MQANKLSEKELLSNKLEELAHLELAAKGWDQLDANKIVHTRRISDWNSLNREDLRKLVKSIKAGGSFNFEIYDDVPEAIQPKTEKAKRYESKTDPESKYHNRERSSVSKPVGLTHEICRANPAKTRKEIIGLCVAAGVNINTATTQYSLWKNGHSVKK